MADRYWVGGSGNWDATDTTNWSDTSGGAGGASAPTLIDDVIFDANSNTGKDPFTVTVTGTASAPAVCENFSTGGAGGALDGALTFTMSATAVLECYGSMTLPATNFAFSAVLGAIITYRATTTGKTLTSNGVSFGNVRVSFNGVGGEWTLGSAFTTTANVAASFTVAAGTFNTGNFNLSVSGVTSTGSQTRAINLGSSTVTVSNTTAVFSMTTDGLTFNAGTSSISCPSAVTTFSCAVTFYDFTFTAASGGTITFANGNTFNNLTFTNLAVNVTRSIVLSDDLMQVNGTLTLSSANNGGRRTILLSSALGVQRTLTVAALAASQTDIDFRNIKIAGASAPWSGIRFGDAQGNDATTITFTPGATKYWNLAAGGNWNATAWALSSGGAVSTDNFPLAQDNIVIEDAGLNTSATITYNIGYILPTISFATRTNAMAFNITVNPGFYGDLTFSSAITLPGTGLWDFFGQGITQNLTTAGINISGFVRLQGANGTVRLVDNLTATSATGGINVNRGTLDLNNNTFTGVSFTSNASNVRSIAFGTTGKIVLTGNDRTIFTLTNTTGFSYTGTSNVECTYAGGTGTRTFSTSGINTEAQALNIKISAGTDTIAAVLLNAKDLDLTGFTGTYSPSSVRIYGNLTFGAGMTSTSTGSAHNFLGTSVTQLITTNNVQMNFPIDFNGAGSTFAFQDALTQESTRSFTITDGTVQLKNGVTSTVGSFGTSGTSQKFLQSTLAGTQATLSQASGTVNASYLTIQDINAVGGATWNAFVDQGNIDAGDNDGWDFGISPVVGGNEYTYQLRSFTQPRRF
jgi:hypothetical protein